MALDDLPAEEGDTMLSTMSTMSKAGTGKGRTKKASTARTTARKPSRKALEVSFVEPLDAITIPKEQLEHESQDIVDQSAISVKPKTTRGRNVKKQEEDSHTQQEQSQVQEIPKPKRGKKRGSDGIEKLETSFLPEELIPALRPTRGKKTDADASQVETSRLDSPQEEVSIMKLSLIHI